MSIPLLNPDMTYFVNGSCYRDHDGNHAGYAIVKQTDQDSFETAKAESVLQPCSAQKAELKAIIEACILASGKAANIYTMCLFTHRLCLCPWSLPLI